jgi:hypothetical protein
MLLATTTLALAFSLTAAPGFDELKKDAVGVERLASTVASLVGVCPDGLMPDELAECQKNLKAGAKDLVGKKIYLNLGGGHEEHLVFDKILDAGRARFVWAPLVDLGNELMLTVSKPDKLSPAGNVVIGRKPFDGVANPDFLDSELQRAAKTGQVGVELVGTFGKAWELRGKKIVRGVAFEPAAIRFFHTRTNKTLAEVTTAKK